MTRKTMTKRRYTTIDDRPPSRAPRRAYNVTMADETWARVEAMADRLTGGHGIVLGRSQTIEALVLAGLAAEGSAA